MLLNISSQENVNFFFDIFELIFIDIFENES